MMAIDGASGDRRSTVRGRTRSPPGRCQALRSDRAGARRALNANASPALRAPPAARGVGHEAGPLPLPRLCLREAALARLLARLLYLYCSSARARPRAVACPCPPAVPRALRRRRAPAAAPSALHADPPAGGRSELLPANGRREHTFCRAS